MKPWRAAGFFQWNCPVMAEKNLAKHLGYEQNPTKEISKIGLNIIYVSTAKKIVEMKARGVTIHVPDYVLDTMFLPKRFTSSPPWIEFWAPTMSFLDISASIPIESFLDGFSPTKTVILSMPCFEMQWIFVWGGKLGKFQKFPCLRNSHVWRGEIWRSENPLWILIHGVSSMDFCLDGKNPPPKKKLGKFKKIHWNSILGEGGFPVRNLLFQALISRCEGRKVMVFLWKDDVFFLKLKVVCCICCWFKKNAVSNQCERWY